MKYTKEFYTVDTIVGEDKYDRERPTIENVGWSLGNSCPYNCKHCYSRSVRNSNQVLTKEMIDKIISQLKKLNVKTVNIGGNEPWYTNGLNDESLLPYIIQELSKCGYKVGITTSGISLIKLYQNDLETLKLINDIDISLDSPNEEEHNRNRGAQIYDNAIRALEIANEMKIEHSIIMCAMKWNFTLENVKKLCNLAYKYNANIRFNVLKPLEVQHMNQVPTAKQFYECYQYLLDHCSVIDASEPRISTLLNKERPHGCSCGQTSFRIHSINEDGTIPVSPCIYLHDFKVGDILTDDIYDILDSEPFSEFRKRAKYYKNIKGCESCPKIDICKGGCAAQAYLQHYWETKERTLNIKEPNCWNDYYGDSNYQIKYEDFDLDTSLVHINYLCTWIGKVNSLVESE